MSPCRSPSRFSLPILLLLAGILLASAAPVSAAGQPWEAETLDPVALKQVLEATGKEIAALPGGDAATSTSNAQRAILERRQGLLQNLISTLTSWQSLSEKIDAAETSPAAGKKRGQAATAKTAPPEPALPTDADITPEGLDQLRNRVEQAHSRINRLSGEYQDDRERLDQIPELLTAARNRADQADSDAARLAQETAAGDGNNLLLLQQENASLEQRAAQLAVKLLEAEQQLLQQLGPGMSTRLDQAKNKLIPLEKTFTAYKEALAKKQQQQATALAQEAERKQQQAAQAESPSERLLANTEAQIAAVNSDNADLAAVRTELANEILDLESGLKKDQSDLKEIQGMIAAVGATGPAADLLREIYADIERRRRNLKESVSPETFQVIKRSLAESVANQQRLSGFGQKLREQIAALPGDQAESAAFADNIAKLEKDMRATLYKKGELLRSINHEGRKLRTLPAQRLAVLDDLEAFVAEHVLWMQDARPLDKEVLETAYAELFSRDRNGSVVNWWQLLNTRQSLGQVNELFGHVYSGAIAILILLIIPLLLWWFIRDSFSVHQPFIRNLLATMVFPAYLLATAAVIQPATKHFYSALWTNGLLVMLALVLQLWLLSRVFFRPDGFATRRFHMPADLAAALRRVLNLWAIGALLLMIPERIAGAPPFEFTAIPRLFYTAMEMLVVITLISLLRPKSALMRALFADDSVIHMGSSHRSEQAHRFLERHWGGISMLLSSFLIAVVALDILGFRYTAQRLSISVVATVIIVAAVLAAYWIIVGTLDRFMWKRVHAAADAPSAEVENDPQRLERQIKRGLRGLLTLAGAMAVAVAWNLGSGGTLPLQSVELYSVIATDGTREQVTLSNLVDFLIVMVLLGWVLRELKPLFELLVFPYMRMDRGKRYALVTMSRYLVFTVGVIVGLSILRINLGNLGWLVAAMGVGLGFGLQEIFANFVSGLILLVERPIRVGDLVTIGNVMGNVTHISFRATTVAAFDNEEILIPNKDLITGQVTNWTLGNTITRIIIPIQAAYGSDVDKISDILMDIAVNDPEVISNPAPAALFMAHGDSGLDFELRVFLGTAGVRLSTRDRLNRNINKAFVKHGIEIPYPQRDLHIRSVDWPQAPQAAPPPRRPPTDPISATGEDIA